MIVAVSCFGIIIILVGVTFVVIFMKKAHESLERSFTTDIIYLIAIAFYSVNIVNIVGKNTEIMCLYRMWTIQISSSFFLATLFLKIWQSERYYNKNATNILERMFEKPMGGQNGMSNTLFGLGQFQKRIQDNLNNIFDVEDVHGYYIIGAIVCFDVLLMTVWSSVSPPGVDTEYKSIAYFDVFLPEESCGGDNQAIFLGLSIGYKVLVASYTLTITAKIWNLRHDFHEIQFLGSVLPSCIVSGSLMLLLVKTGDFSVASQSSILIALWTSQILYAFLAVFSFRYQKLFPIVFQNFRDKFCCIPHSSRIGGKLDVEAAIPTDQISKSTEQSNAIHSRSNSEDNSDIIEQPSSTIQSKSAIEAFADTRNGTRTLSDSAKSNMMGLAMTTLAKRVMEKDAIIAQKNARIAMLELQLAQIYHNES